MFMGTQLLPVWGLGGSILFTEGTPRKSRSWPILQYTAAVAGDRAGMGPATRGPVDRLLVATIHLCERVKNLNPPHTHPGRHLAHTHRLVAQHRLAYPGL
jgi:hypothetical protein